MHLYSNGYLHGEKSLETRLLYLELSLLATTGSHSLTATAHSKKKKKKCVCTVATFSLSCSATHQSSTQAGALRAAC